MWRAKRHKERKAVLTQILVEEKELCEAINRLAALRSQGEQRSERDRRAAS